MPADDDQAGVPGRGDQVAGRVAGRHFGVGADPGVPLGVRGPEALGEARISCSTAPWSTTGGADQPGADQDCGGHGQAAIARTRASRRAASAKVKARTDASGLSACSRTTTTREPGPAGRLPCFSSAWTAWAAPRSRSGPRRLPPRPSTAAMTGAVLVLHLSKAFPVPGTALLRCGPGGALPVACRGIRR